MKAYLQDVHELTKLVNLSRSDAEQIFGVRTGATIHWWLADILPIQPVNSLFEFRMSDVYHLKREIQHPALAPWRASLEGRRCERGDEEKVQARTDLLHTALLKMAEDGVTDRASNGVCRNAILDEVLKEFEDELRRRGIEP